MPKKQKMQDRRKKQKQDEERFYPAQQYMNKLKEEEEQEQDLREQLNTTNFIKMVENDMKIKATKKQITIEAIQYDGKNAQEIADFIGFDNFVWNGDRISINTLEGTMTANNGDYIIKGVQGEFYPCKEDIFNETYDIDGE